MKASVVVFSLALASVSSFQALQGPSPSSSTALSATEMSKAVPFLQKPSALDGTMPGDVGFDPVGFTNLDWNMAEVVIPREAFAATEGLPMLSWMREAELKHGRICMLAVVGYVAVDLGFHFPGPKYEGITSLQAHDVMVANGNMGAMLSFIFVLELISGVAIVQTANGSGRKPGDFMLDPLDFTKGPKKDYYYESEIAHCRLAMLAFSGLVTQSALTDKTFPYF